MKIDAHNARLSVRSFNSFAADETTGCHEFVTLTLRISEGLPENDALDFTLFSGTGESPICTPEQLARLKVAVQDIWPPISIGQTA